MDFKPHILLPYVSSQMLLTLRSLMNTCYEQRFPHAPFQKIHIRIGGKEPNRPDRDDDPHFQTLSSSRTHSAIWCIADLSSCQCVDDRMCMKEKPREGAVGRWMTRILGWVSSRA